MYGWINGCLEDLILEVYGNGIWEQIKSKAKCHLPTGDFFRSVHYDDESTYALVSAACSVLGAPVDVLLEAFGRHFIYYLEQNGYDSTMKSQGNSLREWIKNVNEPHRLLRSRFPKSSLPEFWTENDESDETGETVLLHYYSTRGGRFVSVVVGIIKEAAKRYFDREIEMHMVSAEDVARANVSFHAVWRIPQVGKDTSGSVGSNVTPPLETAELRCPFHNRASSDRKSSSPVVPSTSSALESALPDIGISGKDFRRIFPSHIIVDQSMTIRQAGNTLLSMMLSRGINILNRHIGDLFALTLPDDFPLNWQSLRKLRDANIEMVTTTVSSSTEKGVATSIKFRGEVMFLNEHASQPDQTMAVFLINPYVSAMQDLMQLDLSLNDLPKHSFQRDVLLIGEHIRSETDYGIKLTQLSKRLDQESKRAKDALKMKRIFVRYVSHEIRTPLNVSILGLKCLEDELRGESTTTLTTTDLALPPTSSLPPSAIGPSQKDGYLSESISDMLDDVKVSCALAVEILNDLLLYEKIDDGIFSIATTHTSVKALVEEAEKMFRMQARAANVDFVLDLHDKQLDMAYVDVDKGKLHQVLRNLVTNAIKFTSANGEVRLTCRVLQEEENVQLETSTGVPTAESCIAQPHFLPLLQRHERGRVSRSDSLSSMGSSDLSQAYSQNSRGNLIHFATLEHDALPYGSVNATSSLAGAASIAAQSVGTSSTSSRSGPQALSSSPHVMNQWPSVLHRQYEVSEIIDPVSAKYSSHQRRKRPRWDDDTKAVSAPPHVASAAMISETEDDDDAAPVVEEVVPPVVRKFVRIAVQDTGPGISAEDQSQLFHEFIQVKADKLQNGQGSGLGLWIAANIMKMHGGRIGVMSEGEGKGSTFLIDIPLVEEEDISEHAETRERLDESAAVDNVMPPNKRPRLAVSHDPEDSHLSSSLSFRGGQQSLALASPELLDANPLLVPHVSRATMVHDSSVENKKAMACTQPRRLLKDMHVLIVDDVPSNRKVVRRLLRDKFGSIDEAENGQVAVNKVHDAIEQGKPFDLILMDFMMPVMNGLDATRLIQARCHGSTPHDVLVIGVTGNGLEADIAAFKEAGADEVMLKPLDYPTFLEHLYKYGYDVTLAARP